MEYLISVIITLAALTNAQQCGNGIISSGINETERQLILTQHNTYRTQILNGLIFGQPQAASMPNLTWDTSLEQAAIRISESCTFAHSPVTDSRFYIGQNIAMRTSSALTSGFNWNWVSDSWFDEYKQYTYPSKANSSTGHYTQMVWNTTTIIGCGATLWSDSSFYHRFYVCNYGPGGNIGTLPPYEAVSC